MDDDYLLLNRLDQPLRFLGVNKDEAASFMLPLMGGFIMGYNGLGVLMGVCSISLYRAFKKRNEGANLLHALYWHFPTSRCFMKLYAPSHFREFVG